MESRIPIISTKILAPRRRDDLLSRPRLLDLLYELMDLRLVIVAAPAGYGKTSLLVDFVKFSKLPSSWFSLDPLDQEVQRFAAHLIAAINSQFPDFGKTSMAALQNLNPDQSDLDSLAALIANDIYENVHDHFSIILDDYHLVEESRPVVNLINELIQRVDENCHFVIASRTLLNLPDMTLLVARSQVGGLSFEELAFQTPEIQNLWLNNYHLSLSEGEAAELARETEGWITGLILSKQMPGGLQADRLRGARVSGVGLYEYLVQQVLERQPPEIQRFMLRTSLLEEFDADLCRDVIGVALGIEENWTSLVDGLLHANLFIQPIGEEHIYLRYHHLLRDFLQSRIQRDHPIEAERIQTSLASTWAKRGEWERSYRVYQLLGHSDALADLVERAGPDLVSRGRLTLLAEWLDKLSESARQRPTLISLQATVYAVRGRCEESLALFDHAIQAFENRDDAMNLARSLARRSTAHKLLGHYSQSLEDIKRTLEIAEKLTGPDAVTLRADALAGIGTAYFHQGNLAAGLSWLNNAYQAFENLKDGDAMAKTAMQIGMVTRALGQYPDAERAYQRALDHYRNTGNLIWQANVLNNLGVLQHLRGHYEGAAVSFEKAIQYARIGGYARLEAYALTSIGDLYRDLDAAEESQEAYHQARPIALRVNDRFLIFYLDLVEAALSRLLGQPARAERLVEIAAQAAEKSGSQFQQNLCRLEHGSAAIARHAYKDALPELETALEYFKKEGHRVESLRTHFYLAVARRAVADRQAALSHMDQVYAASVEPGSSNPIAATGRELRFHLEAMEKDPDFERAALAILRLVKTFDRQIPNLRRQLRHQSQTIPLGPPKIVIQTLGKIQVKVNGHVVTNAEWLTQTARDLFLLILAHPEGMTKEEIGVILWPESSQAELKMRFKNTIYRLRRAAGKDVILFEDDIYRFDRQLDYEDDSESFLRESDLAAKSTDGDQKIYHYNAALKCYKGEFLPELSDTWVITRREQLARRYVDCLLKQAGLEMERRQYEAALNNIQRLLGLDPCLEEAHRLGMLIHAAMGNRAGVMRQYDQCNQALVNEFNTQPSLQTQQLYHTLTH
jgi:DNA-binding SARP family transcriptional activator/tetratricopeptide (TPR) repeat protein